LHLETRRVTLAGITQHPTEEWMLQMARHAVDAIDGASLPMRFALHDRDSKFCSAFRDTLRSADIQPLSLPANSPDLNAFAERRVRSIKASAYPSSFFLVKPPCAGQSLNSLHITSTLHNAHLAMLLKSR
jgi:hypothetical protein